MRLKSQITQYPLLSSILSLLVATLSIQYGASLAKSLFIAIGPAQTSVIRLSFAALFLSILWRPWRLKLKKTGLMIIAAYGISLGCMNFLFYLSLERIPLGIAVALEFTGPLALSLFTSRRPIDFLWAILAVAGLILISPIQLLSEPQTLDPLGILYALLAGACWAFYIIFGQKAVRAVPGHFVTTFGMIVAAITIIPFALLHGVTAELFSIKLLGLGLLVALLSSALPYSLEMIALKHLPTQTFGILMSLEPAIAAVVGLVFLEEHLSEQQVFAIAMIMLASLGSAFSITKAQTQEANPVQEPSL